MKRILSWLLVLIMLVTMLPTAALAAEQAGVITVKISVLDASTSVTHDVGTATVNKTDSGWQSEWYTIPALSAFTDKAYGNVLSVNGGWCYGGEKGVGGQVQFSNNYSSSWIRYTVDTFGSGSGSGTTPSTPSGSINVGGSSSASGAINFTVRHHSNYPEGDTVVTVNYNYKTSSPSSGWFGNYQKFASYSALGFGGYTPKNTETTWYASADATTTWMTRVYNGDVIDVYAGWKLPEPTPSATLTCMDRGEEYYSITVLEGDQVALPECTNTYEGHNFLGWSATEGSTTAEYGQGKLITLPAGTTTVYAVWESAGAAITFADGISDEENPDDSAELPVSGLYPLNEAIDLPTPTRISARGWIYDFLGWTDGTNVYTDTYTVTADATLTAMWQLRSVDGDEYWNVLDAMVLMDYLASELTLTAEQKEVADFDGDGEANIVDAMAIMDFLSEK